MVGLPALPVGLEAMVALETDNGTFGDAVIGLIELTLVEQIAFDRQPLLERDYRRPFAALDELLGRLDFRPAAGGCDPFVPFYGTRHEIRTLDSQHRRCLSFVLEHLRYGGRFRFGLVGVELSLYLCV